MMTRLPLKGVRVLSAEQYGAGPFGSMMLADLGAEVIKIETPGSGDIARRTGALLLDTPDGTPDSQFFQSFNRNKKSLTLNLKTPEGQAILHRLVATSDVVMNNLRGDLPARLGLDHASLGPTKRSIVCAHLSAYGRDNERAAWPGYDYLMQAEAGYLHLTGEPDGPPVRMGLSIVDYMTGITTAAALLAALFDAARSGDGCDVDVSLFDVALAQLTYPGVWYLNAGHATQRAPRSGHPYTAPCQLVKTADGWVFVMCMTPGFWAALCAGLGRDEWLNDERFATPAARNEHRDTLSELLDGLFTEHDTAWWMDHFAGSLPIAPVLDLADALDNPYVHATGMVGTADHAGGEPLQLIASPVKLDGARLPMRACATLGADTHALLSDVGYSREEIARLRTEGAV